MNQQDKIQIEQLMRDKHFEKALEVLASAIEAQAEDIDALYYSAVCLRYLNRLDEALLQIKSLAKNCPQLWSRPSGRGTYLSRQGQSKTGTASLYPRDPCQPFTTGKLAHANRDTPQAGSRGRGN